MARRQSAALASIGSYDLGPSTGDWRKLATSRPVMPFGIAQSADPTVLTPAPALAPPPVRILGMTRVQIVVLVLVVVVLLYIAYRLGKGRTATPMSAVRKMSTNRLSKALYERLERNGRGSDRTRSALAQLGR